LLPHVTRHDPILLAYSLAGTVLQTLDVWLPREDAAENAFFYGSFSNCATGRDAQSRGEQMAQAAKEYAGRRSATRNSCGRVFRYVDRRNVEALLFRARRMTTIAGNFLFFCPRILAVLAAKLLSLRHGTNAWRMSAFLRVAFHRFILHTIGICQLSGGYLDDRNHQDHQQRQQYHQATP
jgi:hypothetical protein